MFLNVLNNCQTQESASAEDAMELMSHSIPSTKAGQCLNICVMDATGIVSEKEFRGEYTKC